MAGKTTADLIVPADPPLNLLHLITYVAAAVGAVVGPMLTFMALPADIPTWEATVIVLGQLVVLLTVVLLVRFRGTAQQQERM